MSGHSKWANIKNKKAKTDAAKGKIFTKLGREIAVAAKAGADPNTNSKLADVIAKAKAANMPNDNIKRSILKATGELGNVNYENLVYEGYGIGGSAVIIKTLTDNVNRTYTDVKVAFGRNGFKLGVSGCVAHSFNNVALFTFKGHTDEEVLDTLMMADCEVNDVEMDEEYVTVYAPNTEYSKIRQALVDAFGEIEFDEDDTTWLPQDYVTLDEEGMRKFNNFEAALDEIEDVQEFYHNVTRGSEE